MIELPEALVIAQQITKELNGKQIKEAVRGNSPHKWAFYSGSPKEYESILVGKTIREANERGSMILTSVEPDHVLILGGGGERILVHENENTLPKKHHLLLRFTDDTYLTVNIQGWGSVMLISKAELPTHRFCSRNTVSPISDEFTQDYFLRLFDGIKEDDKRSAKFFLISEPGVLGIGNGYLQDILFRAKIHPRRRVVTISEDERRRLYEAIGTTLKRAVELNGRDSERDLYNNTGGYTRILDSTMVNRPCPECNTPIEKIQYLGGASYFCPKCQV
jgi:formamidopyrimidine-DNA glycosylase